MGSYAKRENLYLTQYFEFSWFKSFGPLCEWIRKSEVRKTPDRPAIGQMRGIDESKLKVGQEDDVEAKSTKFGNRLVLQEEGIT